MNNHQSSPPAAIPAYLYLSLAILWLYSGIQPIATNPTESLAMLSQLGITEVRAQWGVFIGASLLDISIGILILTAWRFQPLFWLAQCIVVASYSVIVALFLPENWLHPFAPLIKNIPIMALLFFLYQQLRE